MRKIGTLSSAPQAERFGHYLSGQGIQNRVDAVNGTWEVWVYDEEKLAACREELTTFQRDPEARKYSVKVPPPAPSHKTLPPRAVPVRGSERIQITVIVTALCMAITLGTDYGNQREMASQFLFAPPGSGLSAILQQGEVWRLITPIFLHFSLLHLGFNIYMYWILGGAIERTRGSRSLLLLVLSIALFSNSIQYGVGGGNFGGLSGVVYGLFGYLWMRSVFLPEDGFYVPQSLVMQMIVWGILGLTGAVGNIANGAHFGGLFAGMVIGAVPWLWRGDH